MPKKPWASKAKEPRCSQQPSEKKSSDTSASSYEASGSFGSLPGAAEAMGAVKTAATNLTDEEERAVTRAMMCLSDEVEALTSLHSLHESLPNFDESRADPMNRSIEARKYRLSLYLTGYAYGLTEGEERLVMYRALRAREFDMKSAVISLMATVEFRKRQKLNRMVLFPSLVPTRGYNERSLCDALNLPYLHEWPTTAAGALHSCLSVHAPEQALVEDGRLLLDHATGADAYYENSYSEYFDGSATAPSDACSRSPTFSNGRGAASESARNASPSTFSLSCSSSSGPAGERTSAAGNGGARAPSPSPSPLDSHRAHPKGQKPLGSAAGSSRTSGPVSATPVPSAEDRPPPPSRTLFSRVLRHIVPFLPELAPSPAAPEAPNGSSPGVLVSAEPSANAPDEGSGLGPSFSDRFSDNVSDAANRVDQQAALLVNTDGIARTLLARSTSACSDSLDFHALLQPIVSVMLRYFPTTFHFWDKQGRPIMYMKLCRVNAKKVVSELFKLTPVSTEPKALALLYHAYVLEVVQQLVRFNNRKNERDNRIRDALLFGHSFEPGTPLGTGHNGILPAKEPTNACVVVVDCAHARFGRLFYKPLIQILKPLISLEQRYYPGLLHHLYVVNCNSAVSFSYLALRSVVSEQTRKKVSFLTRRVTKSTLKEVIDSDLLPVELGGRCECPGGCIPELSSPSRSPSCSSPTTSEARSAGVDSLSESFALCSTTDSTVKATRRQLNCTVEKFTVAPAKKWKVSFAVEAREEIFWEFRSRNQRSVQFSVIYIPVTAEGGIFSLSGPARVKDGAGHYICPDPGTVILEWENKHSRTHRIHVHAKIYHKGAVATTE